VTREAEKLCRTLRNTNFKLDYMKIAEEVAKKSDCLSRKVGAVLVGENFLFEMANTSINNMDNCKKDGQCLRRKMGIPSGERLELCRIIHAEVAVIMRYLGDGHRTKKEEAVLYVTDPPCNMCAHLIVAVGRIKKVVYKGDYPGNGLDVLRRGGVEVEQYKQDPIIIDNPDEGAIE